MLKFELKLGYKLNAREQQFYVSRVPIPDKGGR